MNYYKIIGKEAHQGSGRSNEQTIYLKANSINEDLIEYSKIPGFKPLSLYAGSKHKGSKRDRRHFPNYLRISYLPDVFLLSEEEVKDLGLEGRINKKHWYYTPSKDGVY